jgi:hypothetical protein
MRKTVRTARVIGRESSASRGEQPLGVWIDLRATFEAAAGHPLDGVFPANDRARFVLAALRQ